MKCAESIAYGYSKCLPELLAKKLTENPPSDEIPPPQFREAAE
jgi:hypothetical protein